MDSLYGPSERVGSVCRCIANLGFMKFRKGSDRGCCEFIDDDPHSIESVLVGNRNMWNTFYVVDNGDHPSYECQKYFFHHHGFLYFGFEVDNPELLMWGYMDLISKP